MNHLSVDRGRKERLLQMIDVAQVYRGCSKAQLASLLDRDPAKIAPDSGNPKMDLLFNLADIIDWPVGELAEMLWGRHEPEFGGKPEGLPPEGGPAVIDQLARDAYRKGDYAEMRRLGEHLLALATAPLERAAARTRIGCSYLGDGRFQKAIEWLRLTASDAELPSYVAKMVQINLACAHLALWNLVEAGAIGTMVRDGPGESDPIDRRGRTVLAHAQYVIGIARRRAVGSISVGRSGAAAVSALEALERARDEYQGLHREFDDPEYAAVASTCQASIVEMEVDAGRCSATNAVKGLLDALDEVIDPSIARRDVIERRGWGCVSGLGIALRHLDGDERERCAAIFSNKAIELAEASENWSLRERAFTLSFQAAPSDATGKLSEDFPRLDKEDLRTLVGTMGRIPFFRPTGWQLLKVTLAYLISGSGASKCGLTVRRADEMP